mgnify:CR=1 FL=1
MKVFGAGFGRTGTMSLKIALEKSNYSKVKSLSEDFVKVCKNLCDENKSILDSLANLEPKNES